MRSPRDLRNLASDRDVRDWAFSSLLVYYLTLAPDLSWAHGGGDGGDLIVAALSVIAGVRALYARGRC